MKNLLNHHIEALEKHQQKYKDATHVYAKSYDPSNPIESKQHSKAFKAMNHHKGAIDSHEIAVAHLKANTPSATFYSNQANMWPLKVNESMKTLKEFLSEAKLKSRIIPTHLKDGKPNPDHPRYIEHSASYVEPVKQKIVKPHEKVNIGHYSDALSNVPDEDSSDAVQRIANKLKISHEAAHKGLSKIAGRDFHKEHNDAVEDYYANESVTEKVRYPRNTGTTPSQAAAIGQQKHAIRDKDINTPDSHEEEIQTYKYLLSKTPKNSSLHKHYSDKLAHHTTEHAKETNG